MDTELADDWPDDREIFLILRDDVRALHGAATRGTRDGQCRVVGFIDPAGRRARSMPSIRAAGAPARRTTGALSMGLGKRSGLPEPGPPRGIELILQPLIATLQPIAFALEVRHRVTQPRNLLLLPLDQRVAIIRRRWRPPFRHTVVMPE
ncbi:MAG: hypothetical protein ACRET3_14070, partial [Burkholderiales bacterium]